jgi:transcriptional regulator with XRE-family HTH domain
VIAGSTFAPFDTAYATTRGQPTVHGLKVVIEERKADQAPERAACVGGVLRMHVKATRATFGAEVQAARGLLGWTRAQLSSECGLSKRSLWNIERGLTARPYAKTQTAICTAFEVAGIGFTINDPPILRSKKAVAWIGPAITTKFAVGDNVHFHPIAGDLIAAASGSYCSEGTNARKRRREQLPH